MISYQLACSRGHRFEAWFRNAADFDELSEAGAVSCPYCASADVVKGLMAPAVVTSRRRAAAPVEKMVPGPVVEPPALPAPNAVTAAGSEPPGLSAPAGPAPAAVEKWPIAAPDPRPRQLVDMLREVRQRIRDTSEYVGERFPEEARRIHYGETKRRGIYGEASLDEVKKLADEGVEVQPLPVLPEEHN